MRRRLIFSMLIAVLLMSPNGALAKTFSITVTGDPGASFVGSCLAKKEDGDHQVLALNGKVPFEQHIDADFVSCRFNASGRIRIEATSDVGQHREAETKNGVVTLSLRQWYDHINNLMRRFTMNSAIDSSRYSPGEPTDSVNMSGFLEHSADGVGRTDFRMTNIGLDEYLLLGQLASIRSSMARGGSWLGGAFMAKAIHMMVRVLDLGKSIDFYKTAFGLDVADRFEFDGFALVYLRNPEIDFEVELTWNEDRTEPYQHGDAYGHIAFAVDDLDAEHARFAATGLEPAEIKEFFRDGSLMARFFFVQDPDGYKIEMLQRHGRYT